MNMEEFDTLVLYFAGYGNMGLYEYVKRGGKDQDLHYGRLYSAGHQKGEACILHCSDRV